MDPLPAYTLSDPSLGAQRIKDFFLARQPILNREQELVAYELLFRSKATESANVTDDLSATASVIAHASELGLGNVIGTSLGFINVDAAVLTSDFIHFLPKQKVVLEILETVQATDRVVARVKELARAGFVFALDDVVADSLTVRKLLPLVEIIKVDINHMHEARLTELSRRFKAEGKRLLAEKVETREQYHQCLSLGFDYFQGYYFAKPVILSGKKLSPPQMAIMQLMAKFVSDADIADIEQSIKQNASLSLTLLRLVNPPAAGVEQPISSIGQAIAVVGRQQLQRWLQILLYAEPGQSRGLASPLLTLATTRGKLLELMAQKIRPKDRKTADTAFAVGAMSLMDALFGIGMPELLAKLHVGDEIRKALLEHAGLYGAMLRLAEKLERIQESGERVSPLLEQLQLSADELYELQVAAFEWSDAAARNAIGQAQRLAPSYSTQS